MTRSIGSAVIEVDGLRAREGRTIFGLAAIYLLRLLGMYMVLPVLSLHAATLQGHTPLLVGLSVGGYGLAQAALQIPFGVLSDRFGRRRVIAGGLLVFAAGSVLAAVADSAVMLVCGRVLQGAGGIAAVVVAMIADVSRPEVRVRAMATLGAAVGVAFTLGMIAGPGLAARFGVPFLFWLTAVLSVLAALYVMTMIPRPTRRVHDASLEWTPGHLREVLQHHDMLRLDLGVFLAHAQVTAVFVVGPGLLARHIPAAEHGMVYLVLVPIGLAAMVVSAVFADRWGRLKEAVLCGGLCLFAAGALLLAETPGVWTVTIAIGLVILSVAVAEPAGPAMLTRLAKDEARGTAAGTYHMCQFLGSFVGGVGGGLMLDQPHALARSLIVGAFCWLLVASGLPRLKRTSAGDGAARLT